MEIDPSLGKRMLAIRARFKKSQEDMAAIMGVSRPTYNKIENGKATPDYMAIKSLAMFFHLDLNWYFFDEATMIKGDKSEDVKETNIELENLKKEKDLFRDLYFELNEKVQEYGISSKRSGGGNIKNKNINKVTGIDKSKKSKK